MTTNPYDTGDSENLPLDQVAGVRASESVNIPEGAFAEGMSMNFSGAVAEQFEEVVINNQIPGYNAMRQRLVQAATYFLREDTAFIDIGTSQGRMIRDVIGNLAQLKDDRLAKTTFIGLDNEQDMLDKAEERISELIGSEEVQSVIEESWQNLFRVHGRTVPVQLKNHDLRAGLPQSVSGGFASVIASVLSIQFVPMEYRPRLLKDIYDRLAPGGAFIFVEKVLHQNADIDDFLTRLYYDEKSRNGIDNKDVLRKRESLEGYLVPLTDGSNIELLQGAGFKNHNVSVFWRDLQFQAYIALKD